MKIGIITTHYALNYGAILQALALQRTLSDLGHDCEIIDYRPDVGKYGRNYFYKNRSIRAFLRNIYAFLSVSTYRKFIRRKALFDDVLEKKMRLSDKIYFSGDDVLSNLDPYDMFICGSDQIWNANLVYDPIYFLDFYEKYPLSKYVSYAPSISMDKFDERGKNIYRAHLKKFCAISVRESEGKALISSLTDKKIEVVLDPVFLLGVENWQKFSKAPKGINVKAPYIFCYFIGTSKLPAIAVERLRRITGYKVIYCNVQVRDRFNSDVSIQDASPQEYVGLIENASIVCTNSFHATAFSVMFKKPLVVTLNLNARDARMIDFLASVELNGRTFSLDNIDKLDSSMVEKLAMGYEQAELLLNTRVKESLNFLEKSFEC